MSTPPREAPSLRKSSLSSVVWAEFRRSSPTHQLLLKVKEVQVLHRYKVKVPNQKESSAEVANRYAMLSFQRFPQSNNYFLISTD